MSDIQTQFSALKQAADPVVAEAIERLVAEGEDHQLNRVNVL
ncbi:MAG: adenylate/guanylate cyclase protein, partial [Tardiphaga sp.]